MMIDIIVKLPIKYYRKLDSEKRKNREKGLYFTYEKVLGIMMIVMGIALIVDTIFQILYPFIIVYISTLILHFIVYPTYIRYRNCKDSTVKEIEEFEWRITLMKSLLKNEFKITTQDECKLLNELINQRLIATEGNMEIMDSFKNMMTTFIFPIILLLMQQAALTKMEIVWILTVCLILEGFIFMFRGVIGIFSFNSSLKMIKKELEFTILYWNKID